MFAGYVAVSCCVAVALSLQRGRQPPAWRVVASAVLWPLAAAWAALGVALLLRTDDGPR